MFDFANSLLVCSYLALFMLSVCGSEGWLAIGGGIGVEDPYIKAGTLVAAAPEAICCYPIVLVYCTGLLTLVVHAHSEGYCSCPVCMCVCVHSKLPPHTLESLNRDTNDFSSNTAIVFNFADFPKNASFKSYGVICLPRAAPASQ